jgi:glycosyltransferase involved in cell wall biosynthesis
MTDPLVTVAIPTYNRADLLGVTLRTVLAQDYRHLEILISDNASTDGTEQLCRDAAAADRRICYVRQPENIGLYANHNFCLEEARGEFVCLFHDDERYGPDVVAANAALLAAHPEVGLSCSDWELIDEQGRVVGARDFAVPTVSDGYAYIERTIRSGRSSICCPGAMIRREALGKTRFHESGPLGFGDFLVWFEIAERWTVGHVHRRLWSYRQHARALSLRALEAVVRDFEENLTRYLAEHLHRWPEHDALVRRWRRLGERYMFWALAFELCLDALKERAVDEAFAADRTVFELADYRLSAAEVAGVRAELWRLRAGLVSSATLFGIDALRATGLTGPLRWAARHSGRLRKVLGLR